MAVIVLDDTGLRPGHCHEWFWMGTPNTHEF